MRHLLYIFGLLILGACSRDLVESDPTLAIEPTTPLSISVESQTRGSLSFDEGSMASMGVYTAHTATTPWSEQIEFDKMKNLRHDYNTTQSSWNAEGGDVAWGYNSISDLYTIFAYSPFGTADNGITPSIASGELSIEYHLPTSCAAQPDLMIAVPRKDIPPQVGGGVALYFHHALASISFGVGDSVSSPLVSISISGVCEQGTLQWDYANGVPKWETPLPAGSTQYEAIIIEDYTLDPGESSTQVTDQNGYLMMIPQSLPNGAEVIATFKNGDVRTLSIPTATTWEAGCNYHYIVTEKDYIEIIFDSSQVSNCYIINPKVGKSTIVQIPIQERINEFWKDYAFPPSTKIDSNSNVSDFYASMEWEDFCHSTPEGNVDYDVNYPCEIVWDDSGSLAVRVTLPPEAQDGNTVFSVFDASRQTLWSWHLWVTSYNPDAIAAANQSNITPNADMNYYKEGEIGSVQRYIDETGCSASAALWAGIYADKFIMDRNIGTRNSNERVYNYGCGVLYYQYGRKDPLPGTVVRYSDGATVVKTRKMASATFRSVINEVGTFLVSDSSPYCWWDKNNAASPYNDLTIFWNDVKSPTSDPTPRKSIFDPSPLGWQIPLIDTWRHLVYTSPPPTQGDANTSVSQYYPLGSWRARKIQLAGDGYYTGVWSATPGSSIGCGYNFYSNGNITKGARESFRAKALNVRAIQE